MQAALATLAEVQFKPKGRQSMKKKILASSTLALVLAAGAFAAKATSPKPKITMAEARATALKKAPGTVKSEELENEKGKLIYSFDIKQSGQTGITEVAVDAINGDVVDVHHETPAQEAAEKAAEKPKPPTKH